MIRRLLAAPMLRFVYVQRRTRQSQLDLLEPLPDAVLFLGDSITEQGNWGEWFPHLRTINRGIGGDTVAGVIDRLDRAINQPAAISLLIGTNDLSGLGPSTRVPDIATQYGVLLERLGQLSPGIPLVINSVMPRQPRFAGHVQQLNAHVERMAQDCGATYVDLWPILADERGALRIEYTLDGLHLTGQGYQAWAEVLTPLLAAATGLPVTTKAN
jgi:lysophospholipase L1-like esterase